MAEHSILGDESCSGAVGNHEARVQAAIGDEEGGHAAERRVAHTLEAALGDARELRGADGEEVERLRRRGWRVVGGQEAGRQEAGRQAGRQARGRQAGRRAGRQAGKQAGKQASRRARGEQAGAEQARGRELEEGAESAHDI